jgi:beta-glucosidase
LKGFERISLAPGESKPVQLHLSAYDISFWSEATHKRAAEASTYDVWVGDSSTASAHAEFSVPVTMVQP